MYLLLFLSGRRHRARPTSAFTRLPSLATLVLATRLAGCASTGKSGVQHGVRYERPITHVAELLRNHPSVRLHGTGGSTRISVRGAVGEPLIVLDGLAQPPESGRLLAALNPRDVASIQVLTDPADLTFHGLRGANGVIVIRTRLR